MIRKVLSSLLIAAVSASTNIPEFRVQLIRNNKNVGSISSIDGRVVVSGDSLPIGLRLEGLPSLPLVSIHGQHDGTALVVNEGVVEVGVHSALELASIKSPPSLVQMPRGFSPLATGQSCIADRTSIVKLFNVIGVPVLTLKLETMVSRRSLGVLDASQAIRAEMQILNRASPDIPVDLSVRPSSPSTLLDLLDGFNLSDDVVESAHETSNVFSGDADEASHSDSPFSYTDDSSWNFDESIISEHDDDHTIQQEDIQKRPSRAAFFCRMFTGRCGKTTSSDETVSQQQSRNLISNDRTITPDEDVNTSLAELVAFTQQLRSSQMQFVDTDSSSDESELQQDTDSDSPQSTPPPFRPITPPFSHLISPKAVPIDITSADNTSIEDMHLSYPMAKRGWKRRAIRSEKFSDSELTVFIDASRFPSGITRMKLKQEKARLASKTSETTKSPDTPKAMAGAIGSEHRTSRDPRKRIPGRLTLKDIVKIS